MNLFPNIIITNLFPYLPYIRFVNAVADANAAIMTCKLQM